MSVPGSIQVYASRKVAAPTRASAGASARVVGREGEGFDRGWRHVVRFGGVSGHTGDPVSSWVMDEKRPPPFIPVSVRAIPPEASERRWWERIEVAEE
jgi:hypothetical protein